MVFARPRSGLSHCVPRGIVDPWAYGASSAMAESVVCVSLRLGRILVWSLTHIWVSVRGRVHLLVFHAVGVGSFFLAEMAGFAPSGAVGGASVSYAAFAARLLTMIFRNRGYQLI